MSNGGDYRGKYRGTVANNVDPEMRGRIQVIVPDVSNIMLSSWAMPCLPVAALQMGMFTVPMMGAGVWVEFENGDPDYPIWVGGFWGLAAEVPTMAQLVPPAIPGITLQTPLQNGLTISDVPGPTGGILIKNLTGAMISVSEVGITISNGQGAVINMTGSAINITGVPVNINGGALTIT